MSTATAGLCDADASGAETAKFRITTPEGGILDLCNHHTYRLWPVMEALSRGYQWLNLATGDNG